MTAFSTLFRRFPADRSGIASAGFVGLSAGLFVLVFVAATPLIARGEAVTANALIHSVLDSAGMVADMLFAHVGRRPPLL